MNSLCPLIIPAMVLASSLPVTSNAQEEELVFQERFINKTGSNINFSDIGWEALSYDPAFADPDKPYDASLMDPQTSGTLAGISPGIRVELCFCEEDNGYVFIWTAHAKLTWWAITYPGFTLDRSKMEITRVTWWHNSSPGNDQANWDPDTRFMVKIGGQWYVTTEIDDTPNVESGAEVEFTFTTEGSSWLPITADTEENWLVGEPLSGSLPDGNIEAIGMYAYHPSNSGSQHFDELEIYAKPAEDIGEPDMWGPYEIVKQGERDWVDTAPWMGWLDVTTSPWIYSLSMDGWVYIDGEAANAEAGAWAYVLR